MVDPNRVFILYSGTVASGRVGSLERDRGEGGAAAGQHLYVPI